MVTLYARRVGFVATLLLLGYLIDRLVPGISDNVIVDVVVSMAVFAAIALPLLAALDDAEHGRPLFSGRLGRR